MRLHAVSNCRRLARRIVLLLAKGSLPREQVAERLSEVPCQANLEFSERVFVSVFKNVVTESTPSKSEK